MSKQRTFLLCFAPLPGGCLAFDASLIGEFASPSRARVRELLTHSPRRLGEFTGQSVSVNDPLVRASSLGEASLAPAVVPADDDTGQGSSVGHLDLVELFGLPPPGPDAYRRALVVDLGGDDRQQPLVIVVGEELRIEAVELTDFLKLPPMLEGIQTATGVSGLVRHGDELALFLDVHALVEIARGRPTRGPS